MHLHLEPLGTVVTQEVLEHGSAVAAVRILPCEGKGWNNILQRRQTNGVEAVTYDLSLCWRNFTDASTGTISEDCFSHLLWRAQSLTPEVGHHRALARGVRQLRRGRSDDGDHASCVDDAAFLSCHVSGGTSPHACFRTRLP